MCAAASGLSGSGTGGVARITFRPVPLHSWKIQPPSSWGWLGSASESRQACLYWALIYGFWFNWLIFAGIPGVIGKGGEYLGPLVGGSGGSVTGDGIGLT